MNQKQLVLNLLKVNERVTPLMAITQIGCLRLSERIRELAADGYGILHEKVKVTNRYGKEVWVMSYKLLHDDGACHCGSGCILGTCSNCGKEIGALR